MSDENYAARAKRRSELVDTAIRVSTKLHAEYKAKGADDPTALNRALKACALAAQGDGSLIIEAGA